MSRRDWINHPKVRSTIQRFGSTLVSKGTFQTYLQLLKGAYRPENLDEGDVVEIRLRPSRDGRLMADQILVTGEGGPRPSRLIGSAQMPSTRLPMISSKPAITSDQNPRLPEPLGR